MVQLVTSHKRSLSAVRYLPLFLALWAFAPGELASADSLPLPSSPPPCHSIVAGASLDVSQGDTRDHSYKIDVLVTAEQREVRKTGIQLEGVLSRNGYTIERFLSVGGFGITYAVINPQGERKVVKATKKSPPEQGAHLGSVYSLKHETEVMNQLHAVDERFLAAKYVQLNDGNQIFPFIEMDLVLEGGAKESENVAPTLRMLLNGKDTLPSHEVESIRLQIRRLIYKAHATGVWHLDLKPANILIHRLRDGSPQVHIIDWGVAYSASFGSSPLQKPGAILGTLGYVEPERFRANWLPTENSDVYGLRYVEWRLRAENRSMNGRLAYRVYQFAHAKGAPELTVKIRPNFSPEELIADDFITWEEIPPDELTHVDAVLPSGFHDSSGFLEGYAQGALAWDDEGTPEQRREAFAEWTSIPKTLNERETWLRRARLESDSDFYGSVGRSLMTLDAPDSALKTKAAVEVLSSFSLVDKLGTDLQLSTSELAEVAQAVAYLYLKHGDVRTGRNNAGVFDPAKELLYEPFIQAYNHAIEQRGEVRRSLSWQRFLTVAQQRLQRER